MSKTEYVLCCGQKDKNIIDDEVILYDKVEDVQGNAYQVIFDNRTMYAKYGELNDSKASLISVNIDGVGKALLTSALYTLDFTACTVTNTTNIASYDSTGFIIGGDANAKTQGEIYFNYKVPNNAVNAKAYIDYEASNYTPKTFGSFFSQNINIPASSTTTTGSFIVNLSSGSTYYGELYCQSNVTGAYKKTITFKIKIEYDLI